ncbi:Small subunit processome component 20 [Orchesella cincta]|uniref:Small subunit processome component 20 n=1 Tax=Orchesella cincta TaxID=48709 RepID=A0A1D2M6N7_ORCCI|nr:Small subunit processome component 20 [Orchesella cincta]
MLKYLKNSQANLIKDEKYDIVTWLAILYDCFYNKNHEEDIGMRNGAQNLLLLMSSTLHSKLADDPNIKADVHRLLDSVILPKLRRGVQQKEDKRYEDLLRVLHAFISSCHNLHGTFKELSKVLSEDIIEGFCDIQVHLRTRAMNKLCKKLKDAEETVSPAVLQAFILPIASHNLFDEERLSKNFNELIDSSIEVLKAVMEATPHDQYFSYLNKLLDDPKKNSKLAKQFERVLIAIMDAFHFDLKLACPEDNRNEERSIGQQTSKRANEILFALLDVAIVNPEDDKDSNDDEKEDSLFLKPQRRHLFKFLVRLLVKLLKKIPKAKGQNGIRSIIPSIAAGLRNELVSVRNTLRKTLLSVIKELGTSHLKAVIGYLKSSLQRGYQKHVLNYTVFPVVTLLLELELSNFKIPDVVDALQRYGFIAMNNHCYRDTTDSDTTNATFKFLVAFFIRFSDFKIVLQDFELMLKCIQSYLTDGNCSDCFEEVKELIFLKLLATLAKEKAPKVRERLGDVLKSLLKLEKRRSLTRLLLKLLMMDKHVPELDTFFLLIGLVIDDTKVFSHEDLSVIIDTVKDVLDPFSLSKLCSGNNRVSQQIKDYMIFQAVTLLKKGNSEFNIINTQVNDFFHKKRNLNRAKKKETVMLHPGLVRKRPKNVKTPFPMKKRKKN